LVQFAEIASEAEEWFYTAANLQLAAEALESKVEEYWNIERARELQRDETGALLIFLYNPDPTGIYFMLVAYAIENLCKGLLVRDKADHVWSSAAEKGMVPSDVIGHDLLYLLRSVNFPLQHGDEELAFRLKRSSVWAARYPVPRKADHPTLKFKMPSGEEIVPAWYKEDDLQIVKEFFLRVDNFVSDQLKARS
jgi:hypothetical protein